MTKICWHFEPCPRCLAPCVWELDPPQFDAWPCSPLNAHSLEVDSMSRQNQIIAYAIMVLLHVHIFCLPTSMHILQYLHTCSIHLPAPNPPIRHSAVSEDSPRDPPPVELKQRHVRLQKRNTTPLTPQNFQKGPIWRRYSSKVCLSGAKMPRWTGYGRAGAPWHCLRVNHPWLHRTFHAMDR